jgi:hypothetical protein
VPPPRSRTKSAPVEEIADPELTVMPILGDEYKKQVMPRDKISMDCGECHTTCYVHVDNSSAYDEKARADLFIDRGGSYNPPLCGFCKRARDRKRATEKAA